MKKMNMILAAFLCSSASLTAQEGPQKPTSALPAVKVKVKLGQEEIAAIRRGYEAGQYDAFLEEMDSAYQKTKENNQLAQLSEMRKGPFDPAQSDSVKVLQEQKRQELLQSVKGEKESPLVQKILSASGAPLSKEEQGAIDRLASLHFLAPGSGKSRDENQLIDLDLEYECKALHVSGPSIDGKPLVDLREKFAVLRMEKMDKMSALSKGFEDASFKQTIQLAKEHFDERLAQSWDLADLHALARGKAKTSSALEEKVVSIVSSYQEKFFDLSKSHEEAKR